MVRATLGPTGVGGMVGDPPAPALSTGAWTGCFTGEINLTSAGTYGFSLTLTGSSRLYVDDNVVV
ncbi:MAG: hypothetical protein LC721_05450, partial [Actinobacteria bacterium]|nr:hypothetical protein [Actinomycetota bacterium]